MNTLKKTVWSALAATIILAAPAFAFDTVQAKIPFSFVVNGHAMPAGQYEAHWVDPQDHSVIELSAKNGKDSVFVEAEGRSADREADQNHDQFVFAKVDGQRYLRRIDSRGAEGSILFSFPDNVIRWHRSHEPEWEFVEIITGG
ncbi:MAG: hypothetical protein KDD11_04885 [Acidobacteria bacterium]|nr:hypothetical protein [Acidobacteriota bacterium]